MESAGRWSSFALNALKRYLLYLFRFSPRARTAMVLSLDLALCTFGALLAYSLRTGEWQIFTVHTAMLVVLTCGLWLMVAPLQGVYRSLLRFSGAETIKDLATSCGIIAVMMTVLLVVVRFEEKIPRTLSVLVPLMMFILLATARLVLSSLLRDALYSRGRRGRRQVLVYGAGVAGRELVLSINDDPEFAVVGFVDDDPVLRGRRLAGYTVWHSSELEHALKAHPVDEILLAIPTAPRSRRREIVEQVRDFAPGIAVRSLPNIAEIASGRVTVGDLREIQIEELLGRDQVEPDPRLMAANVRSKCVMITGAGGSIGSELCRQILLQEPAKIILAERSELALYLIDGELRELARVHRVGTQIEPWLVDVSDRPDVERIFDRCRPDTVFHAAAYKHVPLVEADPLAGIRNNVLGTYNCCVVGEQYGVRNFTLISTDKAVRPSSIMGASKRVCELIVQARGAAQSETTYSAVRFGNVLGSSGSVVPLFRQQIAAGGPVTVTHRDATRYFMTVSEAAQLVVQAGAMAEGNEIFLLDMGEPVRIYDLAKMMIQLSGLAVGDDGREADVDIVEVGLRPGEKVHEELLIDKGALATSHPRIVKASECGADPARFDERLELLMFCIDKRDAEGAIVAVKALVGVEPAEAEVPDASPAPQRKAKVPSSRTRAASPARVGQFTQALKPQVSGGS